MYVSLKNKNFRNLLIGQAISQFGDAGYSFMFIFLISKITGSSKLVGYMGALEALPFLLLGPFAGSVADRVDRKKIMVFADLTSALLLIILGLITFEIKNPSIILLFFTGTSLSIINTFFSPAKGASIPRIVESEHLTEANSLSNAVQSIVPLFGATFIGGLSAYIMDNAPEYFLTTISIINALTFLGSAFFIGLLPKIEPEKTQKNKNSILKDTYNGLQYIFKKPIIRVILTTECILNLFLSPLTIAMLKVNRVWFNENPKIFTYTEISYSLGMLISSIIVSKIKINRPTVYYLSATSLCTLCIAILSFCQRFELLFITIFIIGLTTAFSKVPIYTYIQQITLDEFQGRVSSAINTATLGIIPIGIVLVGRILDIINLEHAFLLMGFSGLISIMITLLNPEFRKTTFENIAS